MNRKRPLIAISSCLLGEKVRFDGGHKRDNWVIDELGKFVDFYPLCPEMAMGLGTPRETLRLEQSSSNSSVQLVANKTKVNLTQLAKDTASTLVQSIPADVNGYIFKNKSPSCGLERVKVYQPSGMSEKKGVGIHAREFIKNFPGVPVCEEGHLNDMGLKEQFVIALFTHFASLQIENKMSAISRFHQNYKFLLMSFEEIGMRKLGRIAANLKKEKPNIVREKYLSELHKVLKVRFTAKKRTNVIQHMFGFLKNDLSKDEKRHIESVLEKYRLGKMPYVAVLTLLHHSLQIHQQEYIANQTVLHPYPEELTL